jgi:hypothetical protein
VQGLVGCRAEPNFGKPEAMGDTPSAGKPEARAEGMRFLDQTMRLPSACASGFEAIGDTPCAGKLEAIGDTPCAGKPEAIGDTPSAGKPEARAEGMRFLDQTMRRPSACASGFEAIGDTPSAGKLEAIGDTPCAGKLEARAEGINDNTSPNPRSHSPGFAATGNDRS